MPISENHRDLFFHSATSGKLDLFRSLLESKDLTFDEALALLSAVHAELEQPKAHPSSMYIHYADMVEYLHQQMPEIHDQVVNAWRARRGVVPAEKKPVEGLLGIQAPARSESTEESMEGFVEDGKIEEQPAKVDHEAIHTTDSKEELEGEVKEGEEEHEEAEEEPEEAEKEEETEEKVEEEPEEKEESQEGEEKEEEGKEQQEEKGEEEKEEQAEENEVEEQKEGDEADAEESETEETEAEENEPEAGEEVEIEAEQASESNEAEEETGAEADHMAGEAAEAAAESEHVEVEIEEAESPGEEEPPMEAGE